MSIGNPSWTLAPFKALYELSAIRDGSSDSITGRPGSRRSVWHRALTELRPNALLGEAAAKPSVDSRSGLNLNGS
jgi:hypothetical protein